jgi:hypothetical protein
VSRAAYSACLVARTHNLSSEGRGCIAATGTVPSTESAPRFGLTIPCGICTVSTSPEPSVVRARRERGGTGGDRLLGD